MEVYPSLAEGIGLENRQAVRIARGFESLYLLHLRKEYDIVAGWSSLVARRAHNPKVAGSNPVPATKWSRGVVVNMPACHAGDRRFDPGRDRHLHKGSVAQSVEQRTENPRVGGSIPSRAIFFFWESRLSSIGRATDL